MTHLCDFFYKSIFVKSWSRTFHLKRTDLMQLQKYRQIWSDINCSFFNVGGTFLFPTVALLNRWSADHQWFTQSSNSPLLNYHMKLACRRQKQQKNAKHILFQDFRNLGNLWDSLFYYQTFSHFQLTTFSPLLCRNLSRSYQTFFFINANFFRFLMLGLAIS